MLKLLYKNRILSNSIDKKNSNINKIKKESGFVFSKNYKKYSNLPFSDILEKSIKAFPYNKSLKQAIQEINRLQSLDIDKVSNYFTILNIETIADYWYYFYILSNVALKGQKIYLGENKDNKQICYNSYFNKEKSGDNKYVKWKIINKNRNSLNVNKDDFYKNLISNFENNFIDKVKNCKNQTLSQIKYEFNSLNNRNSKGNNVINLNSFTQTLKFRKIIKTLSFYKQLENEFPKGILTHIHWPGAYSGKSIYKAIIELINSKNKNISIDNYAIIKIKLLRVSKINPNIYLDIPSTYFFLSNLSVINQKKLWFIKQEKIFLKQYINKNNQCLEFSKDGNMHEVSDLNIRAFLYFKHCKESKIFVDFDFSNIEMTNKILKGSINVLNNIEKFHELRSIYFINLLEKSSFFYENDKDLIKKYLPTIYSNVMDLSYEEKLETAVWFKFENIFLGFENLINHKEIFIKLNEHYREVLLSQKVKGVEIRIYYQGNVVTEINNILLNKTCNISKQKIKDKFFNYKNITKEQFEDFKVGYIIYGNKNKICDCTQEMIKSHEIFKEIKIKNLNNKSNSYNISSFSNQNEILEKNLLNDENQDINLIGMDYVGFEDDPFVGARNFFHNSMLNNTIHINNQTVNQFELNQEKLSFDNFFEKLFLNLKSNSGLPLFYHAGETKHFPECLVNDVYFYNNYINDNVFHAILLPNVKRIGHGFAAIKNDLLLEIIRKKNIPIEFSPISNQDMFYYNVEENPIIELIKKGYPLTINSDDPGIFGYEGVTMDWFYLIMNTDMKPSDMYLLVKNSLVYSGIKFEKDEFDFTLKNIQKDFLNFFEQLKCEEK